jgi:hypothetical protein
MSTNTTLNNAFTITGTNSEGRLLPVRLLAETYEEAEKVYAFRYSGIGYAIHREEPEEPEEQTVEEAPTPAVNKVRSRKPITL